jgi:hypothetical protein
MFLLLGFLWAVFVGNAVASEPKKEHIEEPHYFSSLSPKEIDMYNYIAKEVGFNGTIFKGVCEHNNEWSDENMCHFIIKTFIDAKPKHDLQDSNHGAVFKQCTLLADKKGRVSYCWMDIVNRFEHCHIVAGYFGPRHYTEWENKYRDKQSNERLGKQTS